MASKYTYDQFQRALQSSGLAGQFSDADLKLAQAHPDAGMSILQYKKDYAAAATDEARELANLGADRVRSSYGGYTGGQDGSGFYLESLSPGSFQASGAPAYTPGDPSADASGLWDQVKQYGSFTYEDAPAYTSRYDGTIQDLLGQVVNWEDFHYDAASDPLYSQYRKQYAREGQRAAQDALGAASAASGGMPSSYANTAAGQAANYYAGQLTDRIPELYQLAYDQYLNDYNRKLSGLEAVQGAEQSDWAKYQSELAQYNADRDFDYGAWLDRYNMLQNDLQTAQSMDREQYERYRNDLAQYNTDRAFAYQQLLDEIDSQTLQRQQALEEALLQAEYANDYSALAGRGWDTSQNPFAAAQQEQARELAQGQVDAILSAGGTPSQALLAASGYSDEYVRALADAYRRGQTSPPVYDAGEDQEASPEDLPEPEDTGAGYNESIFSATARAVASNLSQGSEQAAVTIIDGIWSKLSQEQKEQIQTLLDRYGLQYEG